MYFIEVQENVFALLQIFSAIPPPSFSAPAELRMINPTAVLFLCQSESLTF